MNLKLVILSICINYAFAFPDGAPTAACQTLVPLHGNPLPFALPLQVQLSSTSVTSGSLLTLTLQASPNDPVFGNFLFRGFIVQARIEDGTGRVVGFFETGPGVRHVVCPQFYPESTVTHTAHNDKSAVQINWRAPTNIGANSIVVRFYYTIVMNVGLFWDNEISSPVTILNHWWRFVLEIYVRKFDLCFVYKKAVDEFKEDPEALRKLKKGNFKLNE